MSGVISPAERRVADLLGTGLTDLQIANRLGLSPNTVKAHVKAILRKLPAVDRAHAGAVLRTADLREELLAPFRALIDAAPLRPDCRYVTRIGEERVLIDIEELRRALREAERSMPEVHPRWGSARHTNSGVSWENEARPPGAGTPERPLTPRSAYSEGGLR